MPTFEITSPEGKKYRVTAPEGATQEDALARVRAQAGGGGGEPGVGTPFADLAEGVTGIAKQIGAGAVEGLGGVGDLRKTIAQAPMMGAEALGMEVSPEIKGAVNTALEAAMKLLPGIGMAPTSQETKGVAEMFTGQFPEAKTRPEKFARTAASFVTNPVSYAGPGGVALKAGMAATAGLGSEAAGQITEGTSAEPYARAAGGMAGGMLPGSAARAVTPLPISPGRAGHVANLRREGIEPTAGDISGNRPVKFAESGLGSSPFSGGGYEAARERIGGEVTRAALARIGVAAEEATPQVLSGARQRIGGTFDTLAARNQATQDVPYVQRLIQAQAEYDHLFTDPLRKPMVESVMESALNYLTRNRVMDGGQYKAFRSRIERMRRGQKADPELSSFLAEVRDSLDDMMDRSIAANNPRDLGAWQEVRNQYRNLLSAEQMASAAGPEAAAGIITPPNLRAAATRMEGKTGYAQGRGDFNELAHSSNVILKPPPSSGTAERSTWTSIGGLTAALPAGLMGRAVMSPWMQNYLKNQTAAGPLQRGDFRGGGWRGLATALEKDLDERRRKNLYESTR
jgi:hypothetical protein